MSGRITIEEQQETTPLQQNEQTKNNDAPVRKAGHYTTVSPRYGKAPGILHTVSFIIH